MNNIYDVFKVIGLALLILGVLLCGFLVISQSGGTCPPWQECVKIIP